MEFDLDAIMKMVVEFVTTYGLKLIVGLVVLYIGLKVVKVIMRSIEKRMEARKVDETLRPFISGVLSTLLRIMVIISALSLMGLEMTSFVAVLGAASLAVGMALSGTLQNFAGGVVILILRPYKAGDFIEAQGYLGVVSEIQVFHTILKTTDNKTVIIPNGPLSTDSLVNYTREKTRRVDFIFGIAYGDNVQTARETLMEIFANDARILKDPEPFVGLGALADSSVNLTTRVWVKTEDYWDVFFQTQETVYKKFEEKGLSIPFPQMDVHVHKDN